MLHPKNTTTLTKFLASLGCKLKIGYDWSAASESERRVVFTIWQTGLADERYKLWSKESSKKVKSGAKRLLTHIEVALDKSVEVFGVLCHERFDGDGKKHRSYFDEQNLLVLELTDAPQSIIAKVVGEISVNDVLAGKLGSAKHRRLPVLEDLDQVPEGCERPSKKIVMTEVYMRDGMIRTYVKKRAKGSCEICGERGFLLPDGSYYLEAHHILGLANDGADTIYNVIALCSGHHREAHYGKQASLLNKKCAKTLIKLAG